MCHKLNSAVLLVLIGTLIFGAAERVRADNVYYVSGGNDGSHYNFGTVNSSGNANTITTSPPGPPNVNTLIAAPNGNLYGFYTGENWGNGVWGSINPATGAFTQIGNLNTYFPGGWSDPNPSWGFSLAFGPSGTLYATGIGTDNNCDFGTLNLTTGAFTKIANAPFPFAGSIAASGSTLYYVSGGNDGSHYTFGTVNSSGNATIISTSPPGPPYVNTLIAAPNGNLYGFYTGENWGNGVWGSINPATGAFTQIGNLNTYFPGGWSDPNPGWGYSLAFGPSGTLYATGIGTDNNCDFGTLDLTTGAFTKIATAPFPFEGSIAAPVPEPSTIVLLGVGVFSLLAYGWQWRRAAK